MEMNTKEFLDLVEDKAGLRSSLLLDNMDVRFDNERLINLKMSGSKILDTNFHSINIDVLNIPFSIIKDFSITSNSNVKTLYQGYSNCAGISIYNSNVYTYKVTESNLSSLEIKRSNIDLLDLKESMIKNSFLKNSNINHLEVKDSNLKDLDINKTNFNNFYVFNSKFVNFFTDNISVKDLYLENSLLKNVDFSNISPNKITITECPSLDLVHFDDVRISEGRISSSKLESSSFINSDLSNITAKNSEFIGVSFQNTQFKNCSFYNCDFSHSVFTGSNIDENVDLHFCKGNNKEIKHFVLQDTHITYTSNTIFINNDKYNLEYYLNNKDTDELIKTLIESNPANPTIVVDEYKNV